MFLLLLLQFLMSLAICLLAIRTEIINSNRRNLMSEKLISSELLIYSWSSTKLEIANAMVRVNYMKRVHHPVSYDSHDTQLLIP